MWIAVAIFNPLLGFLTMGILPIPTIIQNSNYALAEVGRVSTLVDGRVFGKVNINNQLLHQVAGGQWLNIFVSVDATLVLCGSVLTAYVGIVGLVRRMTLDR